MTPGPGRPSEVAFIDALARGFLRSPLQTNARHESDAELVRLPGTGTILAITTDTISEEIETGLYADPYLIGWMTVLVNASDLAAVGAVPLGILLSQTLPAGMSGGDLRQLQRGLHDASTASGLPVLGGDTNRGARLHMGACAVGLVTDGVPLTRRGARPGDVLFASGPLGLGGAFALDRLVQSNGAPLSFRPQPRIQEGQILRRFASCCMDTSDGVIPALDELARLNGVGFVLKRPVSELLGLPAITASRAARLPPWVMLAGPHGEFELLFTVPAATVAAFQTAAATLGWRPLACGVVDTEPGVWLQADAHWTSLDTPAVREAFSQAGGDIQRYIERLLAINEAMRAGSRAARRTAALAPA